MVDKEIIIDGVDVGKCKQHKRCVLPDNIGCKIDDMICCDKPNCYYKQLARKTQEFETICKAFDIEYGYDEETGAIIGRCNKLIEKEKVLEEYKQSLDEKNKFLQDLGISASGEFKRIKFYIEDLKNKYDEKVKELEEKLKRKTQECEELKEECEEHRSNAESYCKSYQYSCVVNGKITDKALKYKQALDEIAAHYQKVIKNITNYDDSYDASISIEALHNISDIINKAKGGV